MNRQLAEKFTCKTSSITGMILLLYLFLPVHSYTQNKSFSVEKTSFSSSIAEDFAPVWFNKGLVYCSNAINNAVVSIKSENENLFNILYVEQKDSSSWKSPEIFAEELTTILNEGSATFTPSGKTIYYARNNKIEGKLKDINVPSNKLGIFSSEFEDGKWDTAIAFEYNNDNFSLGTPALSADGNRLYFASDLPEGYGGTDIYSCEQINGKWSKPKNLGPEINTAMNESYPYACPSGKLFFSSDGHNSIGGKDIFYSVQINGNWSKPIRLDTEINSKADDYAIITDKNFETGYFSSNRRGSSDIFSFKTIIPQFGYCDTVKPMKKCFRFSDERFTDTLHLDHEWDFGFGIKKAGITVEQCFEKPGNYSAVLTIIHKIADSVFTMKTRYDFTVDFPGYLTIACDKASVVNTSFAIETNALEINNKIEKVLWDFGDRYHAPLTKLTHNFVNPGTYFFNLGIIEEENELGFTPKYCLTKKIIIYPDYQQLAVNEFNYQNPNDNSKKIIKALSEDNKTEIYQINCYLLAELECMKSDSISTMLRNLSSYAIRIDNTGNLKEDSFQHLGFFISLLKKNPNLKLEVAVHQDGKGSPKSNQQTTEEVAKGIRTYFLANGIAPESIACKAYGDTRNLHDKAGNISDELNKRIEFILINQQQ
ncbi:MAG: PD40 domain-containing protein [Bacteroidales bacterium]|nr:PD40 domain-containing protein [Bacteroidales bacterium]MBN2819013.1 PD40 domain-containing protein [Bacteroidales bacterium]